MGEHHLADGIMNRLQCSNDMANIFDCTHKVLSEIKFPGSLVSHNLIAVQICDIEDPEFQKLLSQSELQQTPDVISGWFSRELFSHICASARNSFDSLFDKSEYIAIS